MKKIVLLTFIFTIFLLVSVKLLDAQTLVASYPFNGNANDASGNGNHGTVNGGTALTTDRFGNANSAYSFGGVSADFIQVPNNAAIQLGDSYTISAWVMPNAFFPGSNQANFILCKGNQNTEGHYNLQYGDFLDGSPGTLTPSQMNFASTIHKGGTEQYAFENPVTQPVQLNTWYNITATFDGTDLLLYVNGKLKASSVITGTFGVLNTGPLFIGKSVDNTYFVNGKIDDIKIYDGSLSSSQVFDEYANDLIKPGSGNGVQLTRTGSRSTDPWINLGGGYDFGAEPFTYETWVKRDDLHTTLNNYGLVLITSEPDNGWGVGIDNANRLFFTKVGINAVFSSAGTGISDTEWHHVAVVYTGTQIQFYIDGVAAGTTAYTDNFTGGGNYTIGARQVFGNSNGDQTLNGQIDESRIWRNTALTQTQIRDWMCRKISSAHPVYANLFAYFRMDEGSGTITGGYNAKFGTLINSPAWQTSGASLGDAVVHDFVNVTKIASIGAATGENFAVTSTNGNPDGILVYRVDAAPNTNAGANNGGNNKYFGVFQSGGTSPQYTAVYNYTGNPLVHAGNEPSLRLSKRANNAVSTWTQLSALPNEPANTITATGESTEYILGQVGNPLPVTLLSFAVSRCNNQVCLWWSTENETNFSHYEIEKSNNGQQFITIGAETARNNGGISQYSGMDNSPAPGENYYRLKLVDLDGRYTYSRIAKVNLGISAETTLQPNPAGDFIVLKGLGDFEMLRIVDMAGRIQLQKNVHQPIQQIDIKNLQRGIYIVQLFKKGTVTAIQFIKQ